MLSRSHIEEANRQLHEMHKRLTSLENTIQEQNQHLLDKDVKYENLQRVTESKVQELEHLKKKHEELKQNLLVRDKEIGILTARLESFSGIFKYLPSLESLVESVKNLKKTGMSSDQREDGNGQEDTFAEVGVNGVSVAAMAKNFVTNPRSRHFSISEDDSDKEVENINGLTSNEKSDTQNYKKDKEFYL